MSRDQCHARVMGVVNLTPDSFSDGGFYQSPQQAVDQCLRLIDDGADILDLGAESSRPGAAPVDADSEWQRLAPVLQDLAKRPLKVTLSIDSYKEETIARALDFGITMVNNIAGLYDRTYCEQLAAVPGLAYVCMHMRTNPQQMQTDPLRGDAAVRDVESFFADKHAALTACGFAPERIFMDPGIGFGKDDSGNLALLAATASFAKDYQLCIGVSRKSFIGRALSLVNPVDRDPPSKMLELGQVFMGAKIIRTHAVAPLVKLLKTMNPSRSTTC